MGHSERHHYIPQFFIKGFTGNDRKVSVFDRQKDRMKSGRKSPKQVFYEWNRNTFNVSGEPTDFVEKLYQFGEDKFAPVYKKIIQQKGPINLSTKDKLHLIYFIGSIHWRIPSQDEKVEKIVGISSEEDILPIIHDTKTGEEAPLEIYDQIMQEPAFIESQKIMFAIREYLKNDVVNNLDNWKIYYSNSDIELHLLGDNPIINRYPENKNFHKSESIIPLSKGKTVKKLAPEHGVLVDLLTFLQSDKMVCGANKDYLNHISQLARKFKKPNKMNSLREKAFSIFD